MGRRRTRPRLRPMRLWSTTGGLWAVARMFMMSPPVNGRRHTATRVPRDEGSSPLTVRYSSVEPRLRWSRGSAGSPVSRSAGTSTTSPAPCSTSTAGSSGGIPDGGGHQFVDGSKACCTTRGLRPRRDAHIPTTEPGTCTPSLTNTHASLAPATTSLSLRAAIGSRLRL